MRHFTSALKRMSPPWSAFRRMKANGWRHSRAKGFTIFELLVVVAIIATLASIAVSSYAKFIQKAKNAKAISDINYLETILESFNAGNDRYPDSLDELEKGTFTDPWGNPYHYVNIATADSKEWRRDRNNKPINTYYDLWSNGQDGKSQVQVNGQQSSDDIIRAWDGSFIGLGQAFDGLYDKGGKPPSKPPKK